MADPVGGMEGLRSIAVLSLQNLSGDPSQEFFSDGATEELISTLGQPHAFEKVISRTSVMRQLHRFLTQSKRPARQLPVNSPDEATK